MIFDTALDNLDLFALAVAFFALALTFGFIALPIYTALRSKA